MTTLEKAIKIIIANEGNYGSVNADDNGALSIGICQWHASRALSLCKSIYKFDEATAKKILNADLLYEITAKGTNWNKRKLNNIEKCIMSGFISSTAGTTCQSVLARKDVQSYINAVMKYDITDENSIVFLSDICNQGGAGAIKRIIANTFDLKGKHATLDDFMSVALTDKVFKNYKQRRYNVYKKLTGYNYFPDGDMLIHTVVKRETLSGIAVRYGTTVKKIALDNDIKNINLITVGQKLKIIRQIKK